MFDVVTLNNQMIVFRRGSIATYALAAAVLACVVVASIYALTDYVPTFTTKAALIVAGTIYIGRIIFADHAFRVMKFKAATSAILLDRFCPARKIFAAKRAFSNFLDAIRSIKQSKALRFSAALVGAKALRVLLGGILIAAYFARLDIPTSLVGLVGHDCFKRLVSRLHVYASATKTALYCVMVRVEYVSDFTKRLLFDRVKSNDFIDVGFRKKEISLWHKRKPPCCSVNWAVA